MNFILTLMLAIGLTMVFTAFCLWLGWSFDQKRYWLVVLPASFLIGYYSSTIIGWLS